MESITSLPGIILKPYNEERLEDKSFLPFLKKKIQMLL